MAISTNKNIEIIATLVTPEMHIESMKELEISQEKDYQDAFAVPNKITHGQYLALGLELPRRRTHIDGRSGYIYLTCFSCKEGWCFDIERVIEGTYACSLSCWE